MTLPEPDESLIVHSDDSLLPEWVVKTAGVFFVVAIGALLLAGCSVETRQTGVVEVSPSPSVSLVEWTREETLTWYESGWDRQPATWNEGSC